jgi:hypothetical protein
MSEPFLHVKIISTNVLKNDDLIWILVQWPTPTLTRPLVGIGCFDGTKSLDTASGKLKNRHHTAVYSCEPTFTSEGKFIAITGHRSHHYSNASIHYYLH